MQHFSDGNSDEQDEFLKSLGNWVQIPDPILEDMEISLWLYRDGNEEGILARSKILKAGETPEGMA